MRPVAQIAQSVEQGIENPRVGGSIPSLGTKIPRNPKEQCVLGVFYCLRFNGRQTTPALPLPQEPSALASETLPTLRHTSHTKRRPGKRSGKGLPTISATIYASWQHECAQRNRVRDSIGGGKHSPHYRPVSYTHLTLPTNREV